MSGGKANSIIAPTTSMYQAKIGMRPSDMPGARIFRILTMSSTAAQTAEISTKVTPSSQTSALMPGEWVPDDSGVYMNQPESGATPAASAASSMMPPKR